MLAFAANSLLCRLALLQNSIDPISFTTIRIISGALILSIIVLLKTPSFKQVLQKPSPYFVIALTIYAVTFSYAYIQLPAATGALILFSSVQITMLIYSLYQGNRYSMLKWFAYSLCVIGFLILVLPSAEQPSIKPFILMTISGVAWGTYSLLAKGVKQPLHTVQQAFFWSMPLVILLLGIVLLTNSHPIKVTTYGVSLSILSGAIASGLGYFIWYTALQKITSFNAAIAQLSVPIITAAMAITFLSEQLTLQFIVAALLIIGGLLLNTSAAHKKIESIK